MLFSRANLLLALSVAVAAVPHQKQWFGESGWGVNKGQNWGRQNVAASCNIASVQMPQAPTPLPPPSAGLGLYHVAVGRGTQNYTCDLSNSTAVPAAVGAVASLWNATCLSADSPLLLSKVPNIALELPTPDATIESSAAFRDLSGHHYFTDLTTAFFNLDTAIANYSAGGFKKVNATAAPSDAVKGQNGKGYGAVPWLKLQSKNTEGCVFKEVYRINTAGGQPPATCTGQKAAFEVEYSAEYWFYA